MIRAHVKPSPSKKNSLKKATFSENFSLPEHTNGNAYSDLERAAKTLHVQRWSGGRVFFNNAFATQANCSCESGFSSLCGDRTALRVIKSKVAFLVRVFFCFTKCTRLEVSGQV